MDNLEFLNINDLVQITGFSKPTIYALVSKAQIPGVFRLPGKNTKLKFNKAIIYDWLRDPRNYNKTQEIKQV